MNPIRVITRSSTRSPSPIGPGIRCWRRSARALIGCGLVLLAATVIAQAEEVAPTEGAETPASAARETWHASAFVSGAMGLRVIDSWSKGFWMRAQTLIGGHPITTLVRGDRYVAYDALLGEGVSIRRAPQALAEDATRGRPFGQELEELIAEGGEKVEDLRFAGVDATLWRVTDSGRRREVWVRRRSPVLPLRVETFDRASAQTVAIDYANWADGIEIPDAFFDPPAGLELLELDYDAYLEASAKGPVGSVPILYPDLLHGGPSR